MSTSAAQEKGAASGEYSILDSIIAETRLTPDDEAYDIAKRGVSAFIEELLKPQNNGEPVKKAMVDRMIAEIDAKLSRQMDEILHHPDFQALARLLLDLDVGLLEQALSPGKGVWPARSCHQERNAS